MFGDELMDWYVSGALAVMWVLFLYLTYAMFGKRTFYGVTAVGVLFMALYLPAVWLVYMTSWS